VTCVNFRFDWLIITARKESSFATAYRRGETRKGKTAMRQNRWTFLLLTALLWIACGNGSLLQAADEADKADEQLLKEHHIGIDSRALSEFLLKNCINEGDRAALDRLVLQLGNQAFVKRQQASKKLVGAGPKALPFLHRALKNADVEIARRAERCIRVIEREHAGGVHAAAARLLARKQSPRAMEVLLRYLPAAYGSTTAEEVLEALLTLGTREGKPDRLLLAALRDPSPVRRAAAGYVLGRHRDAAIRKTVSNLLADKEAAVRLRAALGLAAGNEKQAIPVLIDLLAEPGGEFAWPAQELLQHLAGEQAPGPIGGSDVVEAKKKYRDAWVAWWRKHGTKVDLAGLQKAERMLGLTLIIEANTNRVSETGPDGKVRWELSVNSPMDAQVLAGNRVLIAESSSQSVTERDFKGNIVWQHKIAGEPINCQRLPNGNTFIGTRNQVMEVTRAGKVVISHELGTNLYCHAVNRTPRGTYLYLTNGGVIGEIDKAGKKIRTISLVHEGTWGDVQALPGGKYLVANYGVGKVMEIDAVGKKLWEIKVADACGANRLPSGMTLLGCGTQVLIVDRAGKVYWQTTTKGGSARRAHRR
jgi:HEAT repeat protein